MGIEYTAGLASEAPALSAQRLFERVLASGEWFEHDKTETRLAVRYAGTPLRPHWPEDAVIEVEPSEVSVLFHTGTGAQRSRLLALLAQAIGDQGVTVSFEEL